MLPSAFHLPAGLVLLVTGLVACFAGYRLLRAVLTVYGFILGALVAGSLVEPGNTPALVLALGLGGIAGALLLFAGYFAGVMAVGAALGALAFHSSWVQVGGGSDPSWPLILLAAVAGAAAAVFAQRVVVILATAFGGAHTALVGLAALLAHGLGRAPLLHDGWTGRLPASRPGPTWVIAAWIALGVAGTLVQFRGRPRRTAARARVRAH